MAAKAKQAKKKSPIKLSLPISPKSYDPLLAVAMANAGFTHQRIADHFKVDRTTISKGLAQLKEWADSASVYAHLEPNILAGLRQQIISSITVEELEKASINTKIWAIAVLFDKSQKLPKLEQRTDLGKEIKALKQLKQEQHQLLDKLRELGLKAGIADDVIDVLPVDVKQIEQTPTSKVKLSVDRKRISKDVVEQYDIIMDSAVETEH
jgi:hypothetical protein